MRGVSVLTTIPSDSHSWNLVFMQMFLEELGFDVVNLGICAPYEMVLSECRRVEPELLVVSTVNGHGYMEGAELARQIESLPNRAAMKVVIGGKLGTDERDLGSQATALDASGYDGVFYGHDALSLFSEFLNRQIPRRDPVPEPDVEFGFQGA